jgi:hypothetical protein
MAQETLSMNEQRPPEQDADRSGPPDEEPAFWLVASQPALEKVWDNPQDDVYASLLE